MALAAEAVRFGKRNHLAGDETQGVAICRVVAVEAPALPFGVFKNDIQVFILKLTAGVIHFHVGMTIRAGEIVLGKWRRRNSKRCVLILAALVFGRSFFLNDEVAVAVVMFFLAGGAALGSRAEQEKQPNQE